MLVSLVGNGCNIRLRINVMSYDVVGIFNVLMSGVWEFGRIIYVVSLKNLSVIVMVRSMMFRDFVML